MTVTCHLCQFRFEQPVSRSRGMICCPSCGMRFELKPHDQINSVQIEQIEQELAKLRAEIETNSPQSCAHREKSVIGPVPMQTVKKSFDWSEIARASKQDKNSGFDALVGRVRSALVHLENEQVDDYLRWRESFLQRKSRKNELGTIQVEMVEDRPSHIQAKRQPPNPSQHGMENVSPSGTCAKRATYTDFTKSQSVQHGQTKLRVTFGIAGMIFCIMIGMIFFIAMWAGPRKQLALSTRTPDVKLLEPSQIIDTLQQAQHRIVTEKDNPIIPMNQASVSENTMIPLIEPDSETKEDALGMLVAWPQVELSANRDTDMLAALDQQLQETQTQLTLVKQQYELTRQNNEQLERKAKQNEAESLLWEAYANTGKSPVRSMVLALQAIERFKELEIDVPNDAHWVLNQALASQNLGISFNGLLGGVDAMTVSEDGQWFLFAGNDGAVWLWDVSKHDQPSGSFHLDAISGGVVQLLMTSDINYALSLRRNGTIRIWNMKLPMPSERPVDIAVARCHFTKMIVSEDGRWLAAYGEPNPQGNRVEVNEVFLWDLNQLTRNGNLGSPIVLKGHEKPIRSLAISSNSRWLVSGSEDRTVRVYDLKAGYPATEQIVLKSHELAVNCVTISPDGRWLVTGGRDSILRIWDMQNRQSMATPIELQEHEGWISTLVFSPDGRWLASGSYDNTIRLWRMTGVVQPEVWHVLTGHASRIMSIEFSRQGHQLVSLGFDREVRLWNLEQGNPSENSLVFHSNQFPVASVKLTGDGKWLILAQQKPNATGSSGVRLWPLVFDQAFDFAAHFAETRFPTMYQRQQKVDSPSPEQQEERIAMTGSFAQSEPQLPLILDNPVFGQQQYSESLPGHHIPFGMSPVPSLMPQPQPFPSLWPPSDGQVNLTTPGIRITVPQ